MTIKESSRSLVLRVMERIKSDIETGQLEPGHRLPSESELSKQLGVSRATLREALRLLEEEKMVIRRHGVGTFICSRPVFSGGIGELFSVTDAIEREGQTPGTVLLRSEFVQPTEDERKRLSMEAEETMLMVERVRTADGVPVVYCIDKLPAHKLPNGYPKECVSIFNALEKANGIRIAYAVAQIEPIGCYDKIATILRCDAKATLLLLRQIHYDENDRPVLYSLNYFKADRFHFHVIRRRS